MKHTLFSDYLGITQTRAAHILLDMGINDVGDFVKRGLSQSDFLRQPNCGRKTLDHIMERLTAHGIALPDRHTPDGGRKADEKVQGLQDRLDEAHNFRIVSDERQTAKYNKLRDKHIRTRARLHSDPDERLTLINNLEAEVHRLTNKVEPWATLKHDVEAARGHRAALQADINDMWGKLGAVRKQLPESMQESTITFVECEKGHGRLTASNWVEQPICPTCQLERTQKLLAQSLERQNKAPVALDPLDQRYLDEACDDAITATHSSYRQVVGNLFWKKDFGI